MEKTKTQKGITLIALIITIIVLLILAVVTIDSVKDGGIITHAQNAAETYNTKADEENQTLQNYSDYINRKTDPIAKLLRGVLYEQTAVEELEEQLRKDALIENEEVSIDELISIFELDGVTGVYLYKTDKLYKIEFTVVDEEISDLKVFYVTEKEYVDQYKYGRTLKGIISELENIFIGKTASEISEKNDAGELENWIKSNSSKIIDMEVHMNTAKTKVILDSITWKDGEYELTISDKDNVPQTAWVLSGDDGIFNKVIINNAE